MTHRNNIDALNNLWIVVEQLTEFLWEEHYLVNKRTFQTQVAKRHKELKGQNKIGTISAKQELLSLSKIITDESYEVLYKARLKRNHLAHKGIVPDTPIVVNLWNALPQLLELASGILELDVRKLWVGDANNSSISSKGNFDEWKALAIKLKT